jgi:hypothetical protein
LDEVPRQLLEVPVCHARVHVVLERLLLHLLPRPRLDHLDLRQRHGPGVSGSLVESWYWVGTRGGKRTLPGGCRGQQGATGCRGGERRWCRRRTSKTRVARREDDVILVPREVPTQK